MACRLYYICLAFIIAGIDLIHAQTDVLDWTDEFSESSLQRKLPVCDPTPQCPLGTTRSPDACIPVTLYPWNPCCLPCKTPGVKHGDVLNCPKGTEHNGRCQEHGRIIAERQWHCTNAIVFNGKIYIQQCQVQPSCSADSIFVPEKVGPNKGPFPQCCATCKKPKPEPVVPNTDIASCGDLSLADCAVGALILTQNRFHCTNFELDATDKLVYFNRCPAIKCPPGTAKTPEETGPGKKHYPECCSSCKPVDNEHHVVDGTIIPCENMNQPQCEKHAIEIAQKQKRCTGYDIRATYYGATFGYISFKQCPTITECPVSTALIPESKAPYPHCCAKCVSTSLSDKL